MQRVQMAGPPSSFELAGVALFLQTTGASLFRWPPSCTGIMRVAWLPPFLVAECQGPMHAFLKALTVLRLLFRRRLPAGLLDKQPFPLRPKGQMLEHLVDEKVPMFGSPKTFWCYGDEDFVGIVKRIAV